MTNSWRNAWEMGEAGKWKGTHVDCWRNQLEGKMLGSRRKEQRSEGTEVSLYRWRELTSPGTHREVIGKPPRTHREFTGSSSGTHWVHIGSSLEIYRKLIGNLPGIQRVFTRRWNTVERMAKRTGNTRRRHWKCQVNIQENGWVKALETNRATVEQTEGEPTANTRGSRREPAGNLLERMGSARVHNRTNSNVWLKWWGTQGSTRKRTGEATGEQLHYRDVIVFVTH